MVFGAWLVHSLNCVHEFFCEKSTHSRVLDFSNGLKTTKPAESSVAVGIKEVMSGVKSPNLGRADTQISWF